MIQLSQTMKTACFRRSPAPRALALLCLALVAVAPLSARAFVLTYTNKTVDSWTTPTCWNPNTNWSTGTWRTNTVNTNLRLNIGATAGASTTVTYDSTLGFTTFDVAASGGETRGIAVGVTSDTASGTLNISGGTIKCIQEPGTSVVLVGAGFGSGNSGTANLNVTGGTLDVSGGEISLQLRGGSTSSGTLTLSSGSVIADQITFGNLDIINGTGTLNLNGGMATVRTIKVLNRPINKAVAININGGQVTATTNSTVLIDGTSYTITNGTGTFTVTLQNNPANTFNIPANVSTLISAPMGGAGGFTKTGAGMLSLTQPNTFTGPVIVSQGTLVLPTLPFAASSVTLSSNTTLRVIGTNSSALALSSIALTNATLEFNYGAFNGYTSPILNVTSLGMAGPITVNVSGNSFPITNLTLMSYGSKTGGAFVLDTIPSGSAATLTDTGSALLLSVTAPSLQTLVWSGGDGIWRINGAPDWNGGTATYLEYPSGIGDLVTFDDTSSGTVNIPSVVKPASVTVNVSSSYYSFSGPGKISGAGTLSLLGLSTLTVSTSNDFSGLTTISGGSGTLGATLYVDNAYALGSTAGGTVVAGPANTLEIGTPFGNGVTVSGETVTITGTGVGGARGALRGAAVASGSNVWDGPVILGASGARIGTEDNGNLTVSGSISDGGQNYVALFRPGSSGTLVISGTNNSWGNRTDFFGNPGAMVVLGVANAFPTNTVLNLAECVLNLNGFSPTVAGLTLNGGTPANAIILNNGATPSTLTLNPAGNLGFSGTLQDGSAPLGLTKAGTNTQTFTAPNTYTGPTIVSGGGLGVTLPMSSTALTLADGTTLSVTVAGSSWSPTTLNATNVALNLNFGTVSGLPAAVFTTTTLRVSGSNVINIAAAGLPASSIPLIAYTSKTGGGAFYLGTLPTGMQATLADTGSAIVLNVTFSPQALFWYGSATATWNTNGTPDWNSGSAAYQEYGEVGNYLGDAVTFDDSAVAFNVSRTTDVRPFSLRVTNSTFAYSLTGPGKISGPVTLIKSGTNVLALDGVNDFAGGTIISAGTLSFGNGSLGLSNVVFTGAGTVQWANSNSQDISSKLFVSNSVTGTIDLQTNNVTWTSGGTLSDPADPGAGLLTRIGSGKLTISSGNYSVASVTRFNAGTTEVTGGSLFITNSTGTANLALVVNYSDMIISGAGVVNVGDRLAVASEDNSTASLTLSSGSLTVDNSGSTTTTRGLRVAGNTTTRTNMTGTLNLNGGTLTTSRIFVGLGTLATSVFNFNGGTLKPSASPFATFMGGLTHAFVRGGGAIIDSSGLDLNITQALEHDSNVSIDGGLSKLGGGALTLAGTSTYNGPTTLSGGSLLVNGALGGTAVSVLSGSTLGGSGTIGGSVVMNGGANLSPGSTNISALTVNNSLTLKAASTTRIRVSMDGGVTNNDQVIGLGAVAYAGSLVVTVSGTNPVPAGATFKLFDSATAGTGNFSSLTVLPAGTATFDPATGVLTVLTAGLPMLSWSTSGGALHLSWIGSSRLQAQTNASGVGLSTNWGDYPGGSTTPVTVPLDSAVGSMFFRLVSP